jgi:hypothetical protein
MVDTIFHCINCGRTWGNGCDVDSYGICIECFAKWALIKKPCFGNTPNGRIECIFCEYCKEYYEFKNQ